MVEHVEHNYNAAAQGNHRRFETGAATSTGLSFCLMQQRHLHRAMSFGQYSSDRMGTCHARAIHTVPCELIATMFLSCMGCVCLEPPRSIDRHALSCCRAPLAAYGLHTWRFPHPRVLQICHCILPGLLFIVTVIGCRLHFETLLPRLQSIVGLTHPQPKAASHVCTQLLTADSSHANRTERHMQTAVSCSQLAEVRPLGPGQLQNRQPFQLLPFDPAKLLELACLAAGWA